MSGGHSSVVTSGRIICVAEGVSRNMRKAAMLLSLVLAVSLVAVIPLGLGQSLPQLDWPSLIRFRGAESTVDGAGHGVWGGEGPKPELARTPPTPAQDHGPAYPRLANMYFYGGSHDRAEYPGLARWDVVVLDMEVQHMDRPPKASFDAFALLRQLNPRIKVLAYVSAMEVFEDLSNPAFVLRREITDPARGFTDRWWLRDERGRIIDFWPGTRMLNLTDTCPTNSQGRQWSGYLASFVASRVIGARVWDGIYYDNVFGDLWWLNDGHVDADNDGVIDDSDWLNATWTRGARSLVARTREGIGENHYIVHHFQSQNQDYANGPAFETFPGGWSLSFGPGWEALVKEYLRWEQKVAARGRQPLAMIDRVGEVGNYQSMRFGLASTLMGGGYYVYDDGPTGHHTQWWYDEYSVDLASGRATGDASRKGYLGYPKGSAEKLASGVWRRDFDNGVALVNPGGGAQWVDLGGLYRKVDGVQDRSVNDGSLVSRVRLEAEDGIILLKAASTSESRVGEEGPAEEAS